MKKKYLYLMLFCLLNSSILYAQKSQNFDTTSPDGSISLHIEAGPKLQWSVQHKGQQAIAPSAMSMQLEGDEVLSDNANIRSSNTEAVSTAIFFQSSYLHQIPVTYTGEQAIAGLTSGLINLHETATSKQQNLNIRISL